MRFIRNLFVDKPFRTLFTSWSLWAVYLGGLADLAPYMIPYLDDYIPKWASIALFILAIPLRTLQQKGLRDGTSQQD